MIKNIFTLCTPDYINAVNALSSSLKETEPNTTLFCYVFGNPAHQNLIANENIRIIHIESLSLPEIRGKEFSHTPFEMCCLLKPVIAKYHLLNNECDFLLFLDSDTYTYSPFLTELSQTNAKILLSPHALYPETINRFEPFLRSGAFNAGLFAIKRHHEAFEFLNWWSAMVNFKCIQDPNNGLLLEQKWLDLAPSLFNEIEIIRDPGINTAYWNLCERVLSRKSNSILINQKHPLKIFHFSGIIRERLSKYSDIKTEDRADGKLLKQLADEYLSVMDDYSDTKYHYAHEKFDSGEQITPEMRKLVLFGLSKVTTPFSNFDEIQRELKKNRLKIQESLVISQLQRLESYDRNLFFRILFRLYAKFFA